MHWSCIVWKMNKGNGSLWRRDKGHPVRCQRDRSMSSFRNTVIFIFFFHNQGNLAARRLFPPTPLQICVLLSFSPPSWLHAKFFSPVSLFIYSVGERFVLLCSCRMWGGGEATKSRKEASVLCDQGSELPSKPKGPFSKRLSHDLWGKSQGQV